MTIQVNNAMQANRCLVCLDNPAGCHHCMPNSYPKPTMFRQVVQRARPVKAVQVKEEGELRKLHSNLYTYQEGDDKVEFVANFAAPAVNGWIVCLENDAPVFLSDNEFRTQYVEYVG